MQGNKNTEAAGRVLDLDAQLAARMLEPVPVRLGGHVYRVRTDLTGEETAAALAAFRRADDVAGWTLVLGAADAKRFDKYLAKLPKQKVDLAVRAMMRASVVLAEYVAVNGPDELDVTLPAAEGESSAS